MFWRSRFISAENVCSVESLKVPKKMQKISQATTERLFSLHVMS